MAVDWAPGAVLELVRSATFQGVVIGTEIVLARGTGLIQDGPKSGRTYRRRGITHQASAPGQPPATDTGGLVQSGRTSHDKATLTGRVNWSSQHAAPLEFGTERIEPRPFGRRALTESHDEITGAIGDAIRAALASASVATYQGGS